MFSFRSKVLVHVNNISMRSYSHKTIFGLSSGYGKSGVAVVRVSGPKALSVLQQFTGLKQSPRPRFALLKNIIHPSTNDVIDRSLVLWFPGPKSFTGEDSCEFQTHGGPAIITALLNALGECPNMRLAQPGEFTKRAFFNGKLDLTEVEGLADLINAETEAQRKQALSQADGSLSNLYNKWRTVLLHNIAHLEAYIDFSEDQNIEDHVFDDLNKNLLKLENEIRSHLNDNRVGERLRNGVKTVIIGEPNVGKSSFINLLCQKSVSIVTNIAGTTRDIVESNYNISGYPMTIADTAGLRQNVSDVVEKEGISRALNYAKSADLIIVLINSLAVFENYKSEEKNFNFHEFKSNYLNKLGLAPDEDIKMLFIVNKIDLIDDWFVEKLKMQNIALMSCVTSDGLEDVLGTLQKMLRELCENPNKESPVLSQARHRYHLMQCLENLVEYRTMIEDTTNNDLALTAQKLRLATRSIGRITGQVNTEEMLDVIFSNFCIGK